MEKFYFMTSDAVQIVGAKNNPTTITKRILCLHSMPQTKEAYASFMTKVEPLGWLVYAIDFRGHGESTGDGALTYPDFSPAEHQKYKLEAYEAFRLLSQHGTVDAIMGASIGANLAPILQEENEVPASVLLSAGLNYYGVEPLPAVQKLEPTQRIFLMTAQEDGQTATAAQALYDAAPCQTKQIEIVAGALHGEPLLDDAANLKKVVDFLSL